VRLDFHAMFYPIPARRQELLVVLVAASVPVVARMGDRVVMGRIISVVG
jgi:hypothetical protein